eukprot:2289976-Pyramimonas_sp.AAC.1
MSWLSGGALTLMTFGEHYKVEFWSPLYNSTDMPDARSSRKLEVCQGYFRQYTPLASGAEYNELHSHRRVMVGMLVPA